MIIYSAMPIELILEGMDSYRPTYSEIQIDGLTMMVEPLTPYSGKVVRLISPNPQDYLNPSYAPGSVIHFRPSVSK